MEEPIKDNEKLSYDDTASNEPEKKESHNHNCPCTEINKIKDYLKDLKNDHFLIDKDNATKVFYDFLIIYKLLELSENSKEKKINDEKYEQLLLKTNMLENEIKSLKKKYKSSLQSLKETFFAKSNHLSGSYKNHVENNSYENNYYFSNIKTQNYGFLTASNNQDQKTIGNPYTEKPNNKTLSFNFYSINSEFFDPINRFFNKIGSIEVKDKKKIYILKIENQIDGLSNIGNTINLNKVEDKEIKNNQYAALVIYCSGGRIDFSFYMDVIRELEKMYNKRMIIFKLVGGNDLHQFPIPGDHLQIALKMSITKEIYYNDDNIENIMSLCKLIDDKEKL